MRYQRQRSLRSRKFRLDQALLRHLPSPSPNADDNQTLGQTAWVKFTSSTIYAVYFQQLRLDSHDYRLFTGLFFLKA